MGWRKEERNFALRQKRNAMDKEFEEIVEQIMSDKQPRQITPRMLFNAFGYARRTQGNCEVVDDFLNSHSLMVTPHYNEVWIDEVISLEHKPFAETVIPIDQMTFGDYVSVFGNEEQWTKMKISADRKAFLEQLESIRLIRNDVMHFRSTDDTEEKRAQLKCFMTYLQDLANYRLHG